MIGIGEIEIASAVRFLQQDAHDLLPHATALVFKQPPVAGFRRSRDVMGQIFPLTPGLEHVQDAIENFSFVRPGPSSPCPFWQQGLQIAPLDIRDIGPVWLPHGKKNMR
jgi:hypothetical protein